MDDQSGISHVEAVHNSSTPQEALEAVQASWEDESVFFYGGLLQALKARMRDYRAASPEREFADAVELLELLSFGTMTEVERASHGVKDLLDQHSCLREKLQLLALLSLCSQNTLTSDGLRLSYGQVEEALGITGVIAVQNAVLQAVFHQLCVARLHEKEQEVRVYSYQSRNVAVADVARLKEQLSEWTRHAASVLAGSEGVLALSTV